MSYESDGFSDQYDNLFLYGEGEQAGGKGSNPKFEKAREIMEIIRPKIQSKVGPAGVMKIAWMIFDDAKEQAGTDNLNTIAAEAIKIAKKTDFVDYIKGYEKFKENKAKLPKKEKKKRKTKGIGSASMQSESSERRPTQTKRYY